MIANQRFLISLFLFTTLTSVVLSQSMEVEYNASQDTGFYIHNNSNHYSSVGLFIELPKFGLGDEAPGFTIKSYGGSGIISKTDGTFSAIHGRNSGFGAGVYGSSDAWRGVYGKSKDDHGIFGESKNTFGIKGISPEGGVFGQSNLGIGVLGESDNSVGVKGKSESSFGVQGHSENDIGLYGTSIVSIGVKGISANSSGGSFKGAVGLPDLVIEQRSASGKGIISSDLNYSSSDLQLESQDDFTIILDKDDSENSKFEIVRGQAQLIANIPLLTVDDNSTMTLQSSSRDTAALQLFEEGGFGFEFQYDGFEDRFNLWSRKFSGNEAKRMTWLKNGNVGIGADNPSAKLHIRGGTDASLAEGGFLLTGPVESQNLIIDNNEILARDNGQPSYLHINKGSGETIFGGKIRVANNSSTNEQGQIRFKDGQFEGYDGSNWISLTKGNQDYQIFVGPGQFYRNDDAFVTELSFGTNTGATAKTYSLGTVAIVPLQLPVGATIKEIVFFYKEDLPDANLTMSLSSYGIDDGMVRIFSSYQFITPVSNTPQGWLSASVVGSHQVEPFEFYAIRFSASQTNISNHEDLRQYKGARVTYTLP